MVDIILSNVPSYVMYRWLYDESTKVVVDRCRCDLKCHVITLGGHELLELQSVLHIQADNN